MTTEVALAVLLGVGSLSTISVGLFPRLRVWLAVQLCRGTSCLVTRIAPIAAMHDVALDLAGYVERSGGLNDPRRIKAYRGVLKGSLGLATLAQHIIVGPSPRQSKEEAPHAEAKAS